MTSLYQTTRGLLAAYNLYPKKRLGQNFLIDKTALKEIIDASNITREDSVLEIGTGLGVLTSALADRAKKITTIDPDGDMIHIAKSVLEKYENIEYVRADFLDWEPKEAFTKIIANVPYYITTPIIEKILTQKDHPELVVLTIQKEVAQRIAAKPGGRIYGAFSVFVQNRAEAGIAAIISRKAFYPSPEVDSAVLALRPYGRRLYNIKEEIVRAAFSQKRKMIRSSLDKFNIDFEKIGIDPKRRPETLSLAEFELLSGENKKAG